jgi:hypothetical protein
MVAAMVAATWQWAWQPRRRHSYSIPSTQSQQNAMFLHECDCPTARHDTLLPSCWLAAARHQDLEARSRE